MRPKIAPAVAAALTAQVPSRLIKKLDADPGLADRWTWRDESDHWIVQSAEREGISVRLARQVEATTDITCSCLLAPKCLHVAAVIAVLEPLDAPAAAPAAPAPIAAPIEHAGAAIAERAFVVCADVLATGAEASGALAQAELLRSIHACRHTGLHRLAAAQTRTLRSIRDLRADRPEFALATLTADLREALAVAWALGHGDATPALLGTARRDYASIGNLRLHGVFTEAVVARSGYAGAVTYLVDDHGTLYTRADIGPGDAGRAAGAYDAAAALGDAVLPHRELCRAGLFVSNATASIDRRLGAGQHVRAVRASEPSRWDAIAARFAVPLADQLATIAGQDIDPPPAGWDLVFLEGVLADAALALADRSVALTTIHEQRQLLARDNLAQLARAGGLRVRIIGRVRLSAPGRVELLAIGPAPGETRMPLPEAWQGRANVHYDRLSLPALAAAPAPRLTAPVEDDLLAALHRRIERVAQGGAGTLPTHALADVEREAATLAECALRGGAEALRDLASLAHAADRAMTGARRSLDHATFARAWLRAALYADAARRRSSIAAW